MWKKRLHICLQTSFDENALGEDVRRCCIKTSLNLFAPNSFSRCKSTSSNIFAKNSNITKNGNITPVFLTASKNNVNCGRVSKIIDVCSQEHWRYITVFSNTEIKKNVAKQDLCC